MGNKSIVKTICEHSIFNQTECFYYWVSPPPPQWYRKTAKARVKIMLIKTFPWHFVEIYFAISESRDVRERQKNWPKPDCLYCQWVVLLLLFLAVCQNSATATKQQGFFCFLFFFLQNGATPDFDGWKIDNYNRNGGWVQLVALTGKIFNALYY